MGCFIAIVGILYILSPIDLWPGVIDDIGCGIVMVIAYYHHWKAVHREEELAEERRAQQERRERKERREREKREAEMREERERREAEMRELEYIRKMTSRDSSVASVASAFCGCCGSAVHHNANYCSHCGTRIEKAQEGHAGIPHFCESCGGPLEPLADDVSVVVCAHCGHKHMLPSYETVQVEKIRQEAQKESDHHQSQILGTFLGNRDRQQTLQMIFSRSGTIIGAVFCILALTISKFGLLLFVGAPLLIYDVVKSKSQKG